MSEKFILNARRNDAIIFITDWLLIGKKLMEITVKDCAGALEVTLTLFYMKSESKRCDVCRDRRPTVF